MARTIPPGRRGIGALSERTGCNIETIRYYERIGLLPQASRTEGGHRLYGETEARRLGFIRRTRELGFTIDQVRTLLKLVDGGRYTCAQVRRITIEHVEEVRRKIADLRKIESVLRDMATQCDGGTVPACPVIDALFQQPEGRLAATLATARQRGRRGFRGSNETKRERVASARTKEGKRGLHASDQE